MNDDGYAVINIFGFCFCVLAIVFLVLLFAGLILGLLVLQSYL